MTRNRGSSLGRALVSAGKKGKEVGAEFLIFSRKKMDSRKRGIKIFG
jgi:hypothetical protein